MERPAEDSLAIEMQSKLTQMGVAEVWFDADNTLFDTPAVFYNRTYKAVNYLIIGRDWKRTNESGKKFVLDERECGIEADGIIEAYTFPLIRERLRRYYKVHPIIMERAVTMTAKKIGLTEDDADWIKAAIEEVREIYRSDIPEMFEGVRESLAIINKAGVKVKMVTHAKEGWARKKNEANRIDDQFEEVCCLDVLKVKAIQMRQIIEENGINPKKLIMIGDNLREDIWVPVIEMGARGVLIGKRGQVYKELEKMDEKEIEQFYLAISERRLVLSEKAGEITRAILGRMR